MLPDGFEARVLEPSPPADADPPWFADDPTSHTGANLVTPIPGEELTWTDLARRDPVVAAHAHIHWLDGRRRPQPLPGDIGETRQAWHQVAFFVIAPIRYAATGRMGLRYTQRGFGTPFFRGADGRDEQVRVEADRIVHQIGDTVRDAEITTVADAARLLGCEYRPVWFEGFHDPLPEADPTRRLAIEAGAAEAIGDWFGFATHVLERARRTPGAVQVSRVQLWPEHFDLAFETGSADEGRRAACGASPGDEGHPEPYLYVAPWRRPDGSDDFWNDPAFGGASLSYPALLEADDPYATALAFVDGGLRRMGG